MAQNQHWVWKNRPEGELQLEDFALEDAPMPEIGEGEVLVKGRYFSTDPYMRIQMSAKDTWEEPRATGRVQEGGVVGIVEKSNHPDFAPGDYVAGYLGWRRYAAAKGSTLRSLKDLQAPPSTALGVLGMPGVTAYCGLGEKGAVKEGETVVVSGGAGAVGSVVGQVAKIKYGARVVGIAGSDEKTAWMKEELGFDEVINYKTCGDIKSALSAACPSGIDVYFDNVGGPITDAVMELINLRARVLICGQISQYNGHLDQPELGPRFLHRLIYTRARIEGLLARDFFAAGLNKEAWREMGEWIADGRMKYRESIVNGFENLPAALCGMMKGSNIGKQVVSVE